MSKQNFRWYLAAGLLLFLAWVHWPTLIRTVGVWQTDPDYTHGFLVAPLAAAIAWRRRNLFKEHSDQPAIWGLGLIAIAAVLQIVSARYYLLPLDAWTIPVWLAGAVWCIFGWRGLRIGLPAIVFLWFAAPLPERAEQLLSIPLQRQAAAGSAWILRSLCHPAVASGTTLLLGSEVFEVEEACSGLRMFMGSVALALAFVWLAAKDRKTTIFLLAAVIPFAIFANMVRIVTTALLYRYASSAASKTFAHDFAGIMMIVLVGLLFAGVVWLLSYVERQLRVNREQFLRWAPLWPIVVVALIVASMTWHHQQRRAVLQSLDSTARLFENAGQWSNASRQLRQFLRMDPENPDAIRRLAQALNYTAVEPRQKRRAFTALTAAWRANPNDIALALQHAQLAMDLGHYGQVIETTAQVLAAGEIDTPEYRETRKLAARWHAIAMYETMLVSDEYTDHSWSDVAAALESATAADPNFPQHAFRLATVVRERLNVPSQAERNDAADQVIDDLVNRTANSAESWLVRYRYRRRYKRSTDDIELLTSIDNDLEQALQLDSQSALRNVHILVAAAERMFERGEVEKTLAYYNDAIVANPEDVRPYLAISEIWISRGTPQSRREAIAVLQRGLDVVGGDEVPLLLPLIEQHDLMGDQQAADEYQQGAERAIASLPNPIQTTYAIQLQHVKAWRAARQGDYLQAAQGLSARLDALPARYVSDSASYVAQSWAHTGQYFRMAADADQAAEAYQKAAALDDAWRTEFRWAMAQKLEKSGDYDSAIQYFREVAKADDSLDAWLQAARLALQQQVLLPSSLRDWTNFRRAIESAKSVARDQIDRVIVLEVNQLLVLERRDEVRALLEDAIEEFPESNRLLRSLALFQAQQGDVDAALATALRLRPAPNGSENESIILRKNILASVGRYAEASQQLRDAFERITDPALASEANALKLELVSVLLSQGEWDEARMMLDEVRRLDPNNLRVTELRSQLAWCIQDFDLLEECEAALRVVEGTYGPLWRTFRIRRILAQTNTRQSLSLDNADAEVDSLAQQLQVLYPHMQQTRIAAARVATYRGLLWKAVANYEEAWELGSPRVSLAVDLVSLLNELGETERAQDYVREIRQYLAATRKIIDDSVIQMENESARDAIQLAEALVRENPNADAFIRLGRTLVLTAIADTPDRSARLTRAENAFREAVRLAPNNTQTWSALFRYLVSVRPDPVESQQLLVSLASQESISPLNRKFALAQLNESIANATAADAFYREAIALTESASAGEQLVVLERAAQFFRRYDVEFCEQCCRRALEVSENALGPQRILLDVLLTKESREAALEADRILENIEQLWEGDDQARRIEARVALHVSKWLPDDTRPQLERAIESINRVVNKTSYDAMLLAELYLNQNQFASAVTELSILSSSLPTELTPLLEFLRRYDQALYSDTRSRLLADRIYDQLEGVPRVSLATLDLRLDTTTERAGRAFVQRQTAAASVINRYARRGVEAQETPQAALQFVVDLMTHLIATDRWEFAQQLTQLTPDILPRPRAAIGLAVALAQSDPRTEQVQLLSTRFEDWLQDYPADVELRFAVGNLQLMLGDNRRAIELFEGCLRRVPDHPMTLNNQGLAYLMEDLAQVDQAEQRITQALAVGGRQPQFLDSLAIVKLTRGQAETAVELLLEAVVQARTEASIYLHLAKAWSDLGQSELARYAMSMAMSHDIIGAAQLPYDRQLLAELQAQLPAPGPTGPPDNNGPSTGDGSSAAEAPDESPASP